MKRVLRTALLTLSIAGLMTCTSAVAQDETTQQVHIKPLPGQYLKEGEIHSLFMERPTAIVMPDGRTLRVTHPNGSTAVIDLLRKTLVRALKSSRRGNRLCTDIVPSKNVRSFVPAEHTSKTRCLRFALEGPENDKALVAYSENHARLGPVKVMAAPVRGSHLNWVQHKNIFKGAKPPGFMPIPKNK